VALSAVGLVLQAEPVEVVVEAVHGAVHAAVAAVGHGVLHERRLLLHVGTRHRVSIDRKLILNHGKKNTKEHQAKRNGRRCAETRLLQTGGGKSSMERFVDWTANHAHS
jgi:hypothetical protein